MYNPNQPRVPAGDRYGGRWTGTGLGGGPAGPHERAPHPRGVQLAAAGAVALGLGQAGLFHPQLAPAVLAMLARAAAAAWGPLVVLGALLVPTNRSLISEGALPDNPDIRYRHDADTGVLTVTLILPTGQALLLFHGRADADGLYRLPDGEAIGRQVPGGVLLNEDAAEKDKRRKTIANAAAIADALRRATRIDAKDQPEVCPAPTKARPNNQKERWRDYQEQITGMDADEEILLNGVSFDGCKTVPGGIVLLEAKGPGFAEKLENDGDFEAWFMNGRFELASQMKRQSIAAGRNKVEWHVAEESMVGYLKRLAHALGCDNIEIKHTRAK